MNKDFLDNRIRDKKILFITTKNLDYIRNSQELTLLNNQGEVTVIGSSAKGYFRRLLSVYSTLFVTYLSSFDVVFIGFAPQLILCMPILGNKLRHWRKKATVEKDRLLIIDFFISMYDTLVWDRKRFKDQSLIAKSLHSLDKKTFRSVDFIICDTNSHGKYFSEEFDVDSAIIKTLYLEADTKIYHPMEKSSNFSYKPFTVLYFGSILPLQGVDVVLEAARLCCNSQNHLKPLDIHFEIIGPIPESYPKPISENIIYHDWLSQEALATEISNADLCLAGHFNGNIQKAKRTIPGKAYIYYAMQKPMILGDNEANHELFSESIPGIFFVPMSDANALANKILAIASK